MAKKNADADRRARVEQMRQAEKSKERRRTILVVGSALTVVVILAGLVVVTIQRSLAAREPSAIGVSAAEAACDPVISEKTSGSSVHVGPGTDTPDTTRVKYAMVPPTSGEHFVVPQSPALPYYTAADRPAMETLVHNLEHGYTVLWYAAGADATEVEALKKISDTERADAKTTGKFIVSAWDDTYGAFPAGKTIGISHWGKDMGHRQLCGKLSGEAVKTFVDAYPSTDSPEPNGA